MRLQGKLIKWDEQKAFGFIAPNGGGAPVFIHKTAFYNRQRPPKLNDIITFALSKDKQGRHCASEATYLGEKLKKMQSKSVSQFSIYLAVVFFITILTAALLGYLPNNLLWMYSGLSMFTFITYAIDKSKAQNGKWRTPESTLHLFALVGGWPGAAIAQQTLRHKSQKKDFRFVFWLTVMANCGALIWLMSPDGKSMLSMFG